MKGEEKRKDSMSCLVKQAAQRASWLAVGILGSKDELKAVWKKKARSKWWKVGERDMSMEKL